MFFDGEYGGVEHGHLPAIWAPENVACVDLDEEDASVRVSLLVAAEVLRDVPNLSKRPAAEDNKTRVGRGG